MKKIILFLFALVITLKVNAKTYYSDYSEYKQVDEPIEKSDIFDLKVEEKYLLYKENKIEAFYPSYMEIDDMTKTDETKIEVSSWLDEKPNELIGRNIIEKELYEYQNMKKIKHLKISNLINDEGIFQFAELIIMNGSEKIEYDIKTEIEEIEKIKDADLTTYVELSNDIEIIIELSEEVYINDLKMGFHVHIEEDADIYYNISFYGEEFESIYASKTTHSSVNVNSDNNAFYFIKGTNLTLNNPLYEEKMLSEEKIEKNKFNIVNLVTKYKTEDLYIKYERIEREYLDDYYTEEIGDYKLDLESKKDFYYVRTRDKVEISDNLIIDNYNTKLEELIISTTIDDIKITSNMDYYKNGTYDINFILPFKTIKEKIVVDIKENYIKALEVQNNYLKQLEEENNKLIINNNKLHTEIKEILKNKDDSLNEEREKLIECKYELEREEPLNDLEVIDTKKDYKILIIIPIILGLLILLYYLRKKSIQNNN